ncbi:unnamed protein product [Rotaria sp. Silwood2]|nr:unnamed protein product [Rotaria sp. Silwood2]
MARTAQKLAIVGAIVASIIGYLYQAPHSEGIAQMNRVRILGASMKLAQLLGKAFELIGLSSEVVVIRKAANLVRQLKDKQEDADLQKSLLTGSDGFPMLNTNNLHGGAMSHRIEHWKNV